MTTDCRVQPHVKERLDNAMRLAGQVWHGPDGRPYYGPHDDALMAFFKTTGRIVTVTDPHNPGQNYLSPLSGERMPAGLARELSLEANGRPIHVRNYPEDSNMVPDAVDQLAGRVAVSSAAA